jgi:hypothetical protein
MFKNYKFLSFKSFGDGVLSVILIVIMLKIASYSLRFASRLFNVGLGTPDSNGSSSGCGYGMNWALPPSAVATNANQRTLIAPASGNSNIIARRPVSFFSIY